MKWLSDDPIESYLDDKLNFNKSSTVLKNFIVNSDTPISIGINGKWGSGKTSLMRLIKERLEKEKGIESKILFSWFDTWNYSNEKEIWRLLMISFIDDLDPENKNPKDISKFISGILDLGFITSKGWLSHGATLYSDRNKIIGSVNKIINTRTSREEKIIRDKLKTIKTFREELEKLIKKSVGENGKFVIFIDDLDRIVPEKVVDIIEAIKIFLSCKRCVFVLGCDQDYLDKCIKIRYKGLNFNGRDYIEKIIQIPFDVPSITPNFNSFLINYTFDFFNLQDEFIIIGNLIKKSIGGENPRKIKRLINLFNIIYVSNENELDDVVLFKLLCFMLKWPEYYNQFFELYFKGINKFEEYEQWALPIESYDDFIGYPYPMDYKDYSEEMPPDDWEQYDKYKNKKERKKEKIDNELQSDKEDSIINKLKYFFSTQPYLSNVENFSQYLILLETIDQKSADTNYKDLLENTIKISDIGNLIGEIIKYFEGQTIEGMYFNKNNNVILPKSSTIKEIPNVKIRIEDTKYDWGYKIIRNRDDLSENYLDRIDDNDFKIIWIIYPWKIPKSIINCTQGKSNFLLSDVSMLQKLLANFKQNLI